MTEPVIRMNGISKVYETEEMETHALKNITFSINKGDYVSISGPSGCGKSTLLSIMGLLDRPSSGEYFVDGKSIYGMTLDQMASVRNSTIGFIFQSFNLIDELSVFDNVALPFSYRDTKPDKALIRERVSECIELVGVNHRINHKPNQLSGGQQQRVAIARALVGNPSVLLVDEPTGNLDSNSGDSIMNTLEELNDNGTTICMVTHDPRYADRAKTKLKLLDGEISISQSEAMEETT